MPSQSDYLSEFIEQYVCVTQSIMSEKKKTSQKAITKKYASEEKYEGK